MNSNLSKEVQKVEYLVESHKDIFSRSNSLDIRYVNISLEDGSFNSQESL